jgi:hypothetical protein
MRLTVGVNCPKPGIDIFTAWHNQCTRKTKDEGVNTFPCLRREENEALELPSLSRILEALVGKGLR